MTMLYLKLNSMNDINYLLMCINDWTNLCY